MWERVIYWLICAAVVLESSDCSWSNWTEYASVKGFYGLLIRVSDTFLFVFFYSQQWNDSVPAAVPTNQVSGPQSFQPTSLSVCSRFVWSVSEPHSTPAFMKLWLHPTFGHQWVSMVRVCSSVASPSRLKTTGSHVRSLVHRFLSEVTALAVKPSEWLCGGSRHQLTCWMVSKVLLYITLLQLMAQQLFWWGNSCRPTSCRAQLAPWQPPAATFTSCDTHLLAVISAPLTFEKLKAPDDNQLLKFPQLSPHWCIDFCRNENLEQSVRTGAFITVSD